MSNKFLSSGGDINLSNGSQTLFGSTIGAVNLNPSAPLKTNSVRELVSEKLDIGDVNNLTDDLKIKQNLSFVKNDSQTNPDANQIKIYAKTDGNLYKRDSAGTETAIGGGGGGLDYTQGSTIVENGLIFTDGVSNTDVKNVAGFRLDTTNNTLVVNDVETINHLSIDTLLTNINYFPLTGITRIDGELDVDKIKNSAHTAEIEFENTGALKFICDDKISIVSTNDNIICRANDYLSVENGTDNNNIRFKTTPNNEIGFYETSTKKGGIKMGSTGVGTDMEITADTLSVKKLDATGDFFRVWSPGTYTSFELKNNDGTTIGRFDSNGGVGNPNTFNIQSFSASGAGDGRINIIANNEINITSTDYINISATQEVLCPQVPISPSAIANRSYVDAQIATIDTTDLITKTQNIDLTETTSTKTRMTQPLELGPDANFQAVQTRLLNFTTLGQDLTSGWEFETNTTYYITKIKISKDHISNVSQVVYLNQFRESDNSVINTIQYTLNSSDADYYYVDLASTPLVLPSYQGSGTKWCISTFLSGGDNIQASLTTAPNPLLLNVYGRTNINNVSWNFPTTKGAQDFMPVIDFEFKGLYPLSTKNLQALDINCRDINLSGKILTGKSAGNITDYYELATKGYVDTISPLFIAATDEVNSITTTGEKMKIWSPTGYTINKIKTTINSAGGTGFQVGIYVNAVLVYSHTFGSAQLIHTTTLTNPILIAENNPITINVLNSGGNTASGLKCYLSYN